MPHDQSYGRRVFDETRHERRDPWMRPTLIAGALIVAYFIWQFCR